MQGVLTKYSFFLYQFFKTKKRVSLSILVSFGVGLPGFEPRQTEPKPVVLPLHHKPNFNRFKGSSLKARAKIRGFYRSAKFFSKIILQSTNNSSFCPVAQ